MTKPESKAVDESSHGANVEPSGVDAEPSQPSPSDSSSAPSSYGPVRRRVTGKDGPMSFFSNSLGHQP